MKFILAKLFEDKSIAKVYLVSLLSISLLLISILGIFWVQQARQKFKQEAKQIQEDFFSNQEKTLQYETQTLLNFIENEKDQTRNVLKKEIKIRVNEAYTIADNLYKTCNNTLNKEDLKKLITDALGSIRFSNDNGYFYINTLDGKVILDPKNRDWQGKNMLSLTDIYDHPIIKSEIDIAKKEGEGYNNYSLKNNDGHKIHQKISYVKIFKPYSWYIGYTQFIDTHKQKIQEKVLAKITKMSFNKNVTTTVIGFDGTFLAHSQKNLVGKNFWTLKDDNGNKIIQELINRGTDINGGFVKYLDPFIEGSKEVKSKIMYAKAYKDWQWIIGSGAHTIELSNAIHQKRNKLKSNVTSYFIKLFLLVLLSSILIILFSRFVLKINKSGLELLTQFYKNAATESKTIDTSKLFLKEFKILGEHANEMVSKRKKIEHRLNIETAYFEQLFENSPEAIAITDNESKGIKINKQFTNLFGYTKEDLKGVVIDQLLADENKQNEANSLSQLTAKGQLVEIETIRKCKDGRLIDVSIMGNPLEVDGEQIAIFGIYRDITERKKYEKHLTEAKNKAEESDKLKSAFLANMSHEIRTPMNHIIGFTDIMTSERVEESDRQEYGALIKQSSRTLLQLINDIIDLSKIESKQIKLSRNDVPINSILSNLYEKYYYHKNQHNKEHLTLKVQKTLNDEDSIINTDPKRLEQLLSNLIENAIKFTNDGFVEFGYRLTNSNNIEFFVKDTGIGIPKSAIEDIFHSFRQIDGSDTRQYSGTGLGLTISHRLAEILGGKISVESEENAGTCFYISLPYKHNSSENPIEEEIEEEKINWRGKNILVVDDDKTNYSFFKATLENTKADVIWAKNGAEAVEICHQNPVDLVLMDIQMPIMNGYEATKEIKSFNTNIPIIGQTAYFQKEYKQKVIAAGCDDFLTKPIKTKILLKSIAKQFTTN